MIPVNFGFPAPQHYRYIVHTYWEMSRRSGYSDLRDRVYAPIAARLAEKSISFHSEMLFSISKTKGFALLAFARLTCVLKT